jgi:hypothetical protein
MTPSERSTLFGYTVIIAGLALLSMSAVVPFYTSGYRLLGGVLLVGVFPYLLYGLVVVLLKNVLTIIVGIVLLMVNIALVITQRFADGVDYSDGTIYIVPFVLTLALIPMVFLALRAVWHK